MSDITEVSTTFYCLVDHFFRKSCSDSFLTKFPTDLSKLIVKYSLEYRLFKLCPKYELPELEKTLNESRIKNNVLREYTEWIFTPRSWKTCDIIPTFGEIPDFCKSFKFTLKSRNTTKKNGKKSTIGDCELHITSKHKTFTQWQMYPINSKKILTIEKDELVFSADEAITPDDIELYIGDIKDNNKAIKVVDTRTRKIGVTFEDKQSKDVFTFDVCNINFDISILKHQKRVIIKFNESNNNLVINFRDKSEKNNTSDTFEDMKFMLSVYGTHGAAHNKAFVEIVNQQYNI